MGFKISDYFSPKSSSSLFVHIHYLSCFTEVKQHSAGKFKYYFYEETERYILRATHTQMCFVNQ